MSGGYSHIVLVGVCCWVIVNQVDTCQGVLPYSFGGGVPLGSSQPGRFMYACVEALNLTKLTTNLVQGMPTGTTSSHL